VPLFEEISKLCAAAGRVKPKMGSYSHPSARDNLAILTGEPSALSSVVQNVVIAAT
jgi:hypothetical protein